MGNEYQRHWKLEGHTPVPCTVEEWAIVIEDKSRIIAKTSIGASEVSTIFLGLNHQFSGEPDAPPILFETMIFGELYDGWQWRYSTWEEAEAGHQVAIDLVKAINWRMRFGRWFRRWFLVQPWYERED